MGPLRLGFIWFCVRDPNGLYEGSKFRKCDIIPDYYSPKNLENWAEGLEFENVITLERYTVQAGSLIHKKEKKPNKVSTQPVMMAGH